MRSNLKTMLPGLLIGFLIGGIMVVGITTLQNNPNLMYFFAGSMISVFIWAITLNKKTDKEIEEILYRVKKN